MFIQGLESLFIIVADLGCQTAGKQKTGEGEMNNKKTQNLSRRQTKRRRRYHSPTPVASCGFVVCPVITCKLQLISSFKQQL